MWIDIVTAAVPPWCLEDRRLEQQARDVCRAVLTHLRSAPVPVSMVALAAAVEIRIVELALVRDLDVDHALGMWDETNAMIHQSTRDIAAVVERNKFRWDGDGR